MSRKKIEDGPEGETSLQLLVAIYRDKKQALNVRVRRARWKRCLMRTQGSRRHEWEELCCGVGESDTEIESAASA